MENKQILTKMIYNFSIANLSAIAAIVFSISYFLSPDRSGWNLIFAIGLLFYSLLIFLIDKVIKSITQKYFQINLIEIIIIGIIYYLVIH